MWGGRVANLKMEGLGKAYGTTWAVRDLTLTVDDGEFVTLLGPSGCGKTTTLRMVAGFVQPSSGNIAVDGRLLSSSADNRMVPPERRGMGMVFQSYAVWPHMTVFENVAYPLRRGGRPQGEIESRTRQALAMVHLDRLGVRYPHQLSGGQQQRVALARALVMEPSVLLLDEPLSNLDARLREQMRFEIKELHERLHITVVYVTHDQSEAMVLSSRIAVMEEGRVVQVGTPEEVYESPANPFVATFVGVANFLPAQVVARVAGGTRVRVLDDGAGSQDLTVAGGDATGRVFVCIRPEALAFDPQGVLRGRILRRTYLGNTLDYLVQIGPHEVRVSVPAGGVLPQGEEVRLSVRRAIVYPDTSATTSAGRSAT